MKKSFAFNKFCVISEITSSLAFNPGLSIGLKNGKINFATQR